MQVFLRMPLLHKEVTYSKKKVSHSTEEIKNVRGKFEKKFSFFKIYRDDF